MAPVRYISLFSNRRIFKHSRYYTEVLKKRFRYYFKRFKKQRDFKLPHIWETTERQT